MNIGNIHNWKKRAVSVLPAGRQGEVATLFTVAALVLMAAGTLLGSQRLVQENVLKLGSFAYDNTYRAHFYTGPTFQSKDTIPGQPNSGYTLIRGSLCFTGTTIPSQLQQFWVHTPQDPNQGYPQKACDNTNADTKDDCIVHEGRTVKYIAPQTSRPYCDSPDVGKKNWRAWDFTLKLQAPYTSALCSGLFVSSTSSFVSRDPIEIDMNVWRDFLKSKGVNCGPTPTPFVPPTNQPTVAPSVIPSVTTEPTFRVPTAKPTIDTVITPGPFVTHSIRPTDKPRCPDPKKPCPSVTPVGDCRNDIICSNAKPCPQGYVCLTNNREPLGNGICTSKNPKCNPTLTPNPSPFPSDVVPSQVQPTNTVQAKIKGDIIVNSCKKPDAVSTIICEKNNPTHCMDVTTPITFVGQDPTNPNKWIYTYEHSQAPSASGSLEAIVRNALYENMQVFAQYTTAGLIREPGRVGFPPSQLGNLRAYATIPSNQNEAIINYEVPQNTIVCPPVTPSVVPPTVNPSPAMCKYSATAVVIDEATGLPVPLSQMGDLNKWGLANDKQPTKPMTLFKNYGEVVNGERTSKYTFKTDTLSFRPTDPNALYLKGDKAMVNVYVDTNKWQIVSKIACTGSKGCPFPNEGPGKNLTRPLDQYGSTTDGFNFDCDTNVTRYGWTVKKLPDTNPGQCVMRDEVNAERCKVGNVKANLASTSRVAVTWNAPDSSCPFNAGVAGDHYRIDIVEFNGNTQSVIKTCDNITKTNAECRLDKSYNNNNGDFIRGKSYNVNVYAIKEIPGSTDLCAGNNESDDFKRDTKDNGGDGDGDKPEPTGKPVDVEFPTRQLDWLNGDTGICWGAWSHGMCAHGYNGDNNWTKSITDKRFDCQSPYDSQKVIVRLRTDSNTDSMTLTPKRVDCRSCSPAESKVQSRCDSGPGADTTNGNTITIKKGECYLMDADLGTTKLSKLEDCPKTDSAINSKQNGGGGSGRPQPTPTPKNGSNKKSEISVTGKLNFTTSDAISSRDVEVVSVAVKYRTDNVNGQYESATVDQSSDPFTFTIDNVDNSLPAYFYVVETTYTVDSVQRTHNHYTFTNKEDYRSPEAWDQSILLTGGEQPTPTPKPFEGTVKIVQKNVPDKFKIEFDEGDIVGIYAADGSSPKNADINLDKPNSEFTYSVNDYNPDTNTKYRVGFNIHYRYINTTTGKVIRFITPDTDFTFYENDLSKMNRTITLDPLKDSNSVTAITHETSSLLSSVSLKNNSSSPITSVSIASCDSANKCASNTVSVGLAAGASTKFKPTFSVPSTTRRLSCVVVFGNGTRKQCTPQLVTGTNGLQFTIAAQANNTVSTTVLSPLKTADTNRDCKVTNADLVGLRDLDGSGGVNAADTSLFFSFVGQNACN